MWIRSAYWIGEVKPGRKHEFRAVIDGEMVPALQGLPGVRSVRALWPMRPEENAPKIVCQLLVEFDDRDGIDLMLASAERLALRSGVGAKVPPLFDGQLSHIDCEVL
ncbi:hypothetical protein [uncultured Sphingomonas sp.]|uniref:hypothetical protein n=1 Tax=uncultured Sphingomonas sp. TaxID=158754 RepID=UPI0035CA7A5B